MGILPQAFFFEGRRTQLTDTDPGGFIWGLDPAMPEGRPAIGVRQQEMGFLSL